MNDEASSSVTLYDVSRLCKVSIATVSRVINNSDKVKPDTRDRVREAMKQLGFRPNSAARALAGQQTRTMGVILPDISSGFYAHVLKGIDRALAEKGFHALTMFSHDLEDEKALTHRILDERRVDALILMNLELPDSFIEEIAESRTPLVLLDRPSSIRKISSVSINNEQGIKNAMAYLARECGYRNVGVISGPPGTYDADQRLMACHRFARRYGLCIPPGFIVNGSFDHDAAYAVMDSWIREGKKLPDAMIALNDVMAIGCWNACRHHNISVPEELGIIGFDDVEYARLLGLTTVHVPLVEMGIKAAELAIAACDQVSPARMIMMDTELMIRSTCRRREDAPPARKKKEKK
ncbi:MAG TPA: LacI family DNA-binding transcriptional regulator [Kiritimatiellia bacterium]|nr:LacI family DNA-binding transcriptional regulator [Kiritimatiellia bacterium]